MRYYFTHFYHWEQPKINQLRREGKFVYSVIDDEGSHYIIVRKGIVNRIGFLITDEDILGDKENIDDEEFMGLNGTEDVCLGSPDKDVSAQCAKALEEFSKRRLG